jgi:hypothetical protein
MLPIVSLELFLVFSQFSGEVTHDIPVYNMHSEEGVRIVARRGTPPKVVESASSANENKREG